MPESGASVVGSLWKGWEGKRKKEKGRRKKNRSHRATVQAPVKTARVGEGRGQKDPGETLNRCVKPLSAFLLGNARSGASRKTI